MLLPTCLGLKRKKLASGILFCRYLINMTANLPCNLAICQQKYRLKASVSAPGIRHPRLPLDFSTGRRIYEPDAASLQPAADNRNQASLSGIRHLASGLSPSPFYRIPLCPVPMRSAFLFHLFCSPNACSRLYLYL